MAIKINIRLKEFVNTSRKTGSYLKLWTNDY